MASFMANVDVSLYSLEGKSTREFSPSMAKSQKSLPSSAKIFASMQWKR
jgi:hypothetical protein